MRPKRIREAKNKGNLLKRAGFHLALASRSGGTEVEEKGGGGWKGEAKDASMVGDCGGNGSFGEKSERMELGG